MKIKSYLPMLSLLFGAFVWGVIWYPYRLMAQAGVSGIYSSFYVFILTLAIALPYFFIAKKRFLYGQKISGFFLLLLAIPILVMYWPSLMVRLFELCFYFTSPQFGLFFYLILCSMKIRKKDIMSPHLFRFLVHSLCYGSQIILFI